MTVQEALLIVKNNQHLKGMNYKGGSIDDIVILPTATQLRDEYMELYIKTLDSDTVNNNLPKETDVNVIIICNKGMISTRGMIFQSNIDSLPKEFNVQK